MRDRPILLPEGAAHWVELSVLAAVSLFLLLYFRPSLLLSETTMTGGDTGAHIYAPWFLREHLLPQGQLFGWSQGWFAGFPMLHFYFPLVATFQAVLSYVIPYEIAFKLGTVLGPFFFPIAMFLLLRLLRFSFPTPVIGAAFGLYYLFMDSFQIYGGNLASSLAGEYSFSLSLGLILVFLGLAQRVARDDRPRPLVASLVLAAAALSHLIPVIMGLIAALPVVVMSARARGWRRAVRLFGIVFATAFAITAFWAIPFVVRIGYTANMQWGPLTGWGNLLPRELWAFVVLAAMACVVGGLRRDAGVLSLVVMALTALAIYFFLPQGHAWNGRFIPFWYVAVLALAAYAVGALIPIFARVISRPRVATISVALAGLIATGIAANILREKGPSYIDDWIEDNYEGYESKPDHPGFAALIDRIDELPPGRVLWEPNNALGKFGTPVALMSLPYWSEDHPSLEGMYFESSSTTPFHFLTAAEVAEAPSNPIPGLPYREFDLDIGTRHMALLDVSYYVTFTDKARDAAIDHPELALVDTVGEFSIFTVPTPGHAVVPEYEPVVLTEGDWIDANIEWFSEVDDLDVPLASDGPDGWERVDSPGSVPRDPTSDGGRGYPAQVGHDEISFETDSVGEPHWVKTSYFPNWTAEGALGPYRASPTMMLVIPTEERVVLRYGRTWAEWTGIAITVIAIVILAVPRTRRLVVDLALR